MTPNNAPLSPVPPSSIEPAPMLQDEKVPIETPHQSLYHDEVNEDRSQALSSSLSLATASQNGSIQVPTRDSQLRDVPSTEVKGKRSPAGSPLWMPSAVSPAQITFSAMQFLPVPLIILNDLKTVVLANEAMGKLLGLVENSPSYHEEPSSISERLRGQTLSQLGIDLIQDGRPIWISWEAFLENLKVEMGAKASDTQHPSTTVDNTTESSPTKGDSPWPGNHNLSSGKIAVDSAVDVIVTSREFHSTAIPKLRRSDFQTTATMIISIWKVENYQTYFTLTFSNADSPLPPPKTDHRIPVARPSTLEAADRKTIPASNSSSMGSSGGSSSTSIILSPSVSITSNPLPSIVPPARLPQSSTPSFLQKATMIKDALLDSAKMPTLAMWKDGSAPVYNKAAKELFVDSADHGDSLDGFELLPKWEVWDEDFTQRCEPSEYPIAVLLREQKPFSGRRVGMFNQKSNRRIIYDVQGDVLTDDDSGEVVGGVVTCRDITPFAEELAEEITKIKEADDERFKLICDCMPQMVWTTTPDGMHDFFNNRWYDYTGLSPDESLGLGWKNPFHPDDMASTEKRWKHSLKTGDPYFTEYRCLSKDGEWRWMIGRALPLKNKETGEIEKWFGTCTDVHEVIEARLAAKRTREQLLSVLAHAQTTIFSVDRDRKVTMLEGALVWNEGNDTLSTDSSESNHDSRKYIGRNVEEVFNDLNPRLRQGEIPSFLKPISYLLAGGAANDMVHEHEIDDHFYRTRFMPVTENKPTLGRRARPSIEGVIGVIMNVTELKEREQDLKTQVQETRVHMANEAAAKEASRAAKEASRLKSQFLANMSHEIRTPITGVIGMAELLLDLPLGDEQRDYAQNISRSAIALLTVINDILDFSKVESGRLDIEEVQFSLSMVIQDVSKMLSFAAERKSLAFHSNIAPDIEKDLVVLGDPGRVRQIITNLITNSIKFTNSGFVEFSVWKERETDEVLETKFVIKDTGIGIDEDVRKRLFKPFSQGDPSTARKFGGTGLGLTISKNLLDLMKGKIELQSSAGNGTTATFWIPFTKPQTPERAALVDIGPLPDRLQSELSASCNSSEPEHYLNSPISDVKHSSSLPDMSRPKGRPRATPLPLHLVADGDTLSMQERANIQVLVVEDNAINQQIALKTIQKLGFKVSAAWNGKEALDYIEAAQEDKLAKPDIILMDVQMPVIDGYKCTHILRNHSPYKAFAANVPIVAMTASAIQGDREKCTQAGMDDYLAKPVKSKILEKMLVRWSKTALKPVAGTPWAHIPVSDCSEPIGPSCGISPGPSSLEVDVSPGEGWMDGYSTHMAAYHEDVTSANLLTPRPLVMDTRHDINSFPFGVSQPSRSLSSNELAMHLRDDKLLGAVGATVPAISPPTGGALNEGESLTKENVERLEMLEAQRRDS
ncbi:hypothetical protein F5Y16DRAFT_336228 [Xylariaceae sp. FL0255]|nr:hypothetical protein F5Y16DRAFT_336228 [Xylariaceae sp. FL0255]